MATRKTDKEPVEEFAPEVLAEAQEQQGNWEFIDRIPSPFDVLELLKTLPKWWGVEPAEFADYVQALPSDKKIKVSERTPNGGTRKVERWFSVITLYFSVAARLQMLRVAQELHGWRVDFVPEPTTPTGVPGFVVMDGDRIVYREYVEIWAPLALQATAARLDRPPELPAADDPNPPPLEVMALGLNAMPEHEEIRTRWIHGQQFELLGRRPGMAWVPYSGGSQAKGSNPYEKVETAARGRALAAWGFGVLPGSGVASLEEMMGVPQNRAAIEGEAAAAQPAGQRETPAELIQQILATAEQARMLVAAEDEYWGLTKIRDWMKRAGADDVATAVDQDGVTVLELDLTKVKPAILLMGRNAWRDRLVEIRAKIERDTTPS